MKRCLVVTVDTEEEGLWGGGFRSSGNTVENIQHVPRFQAICDRYEVKPTYLVTAPVVTDQSAARVLSEIHEDGRCEIGTHLHPWCTPPITRSEVRASETFMCNLPASEQRAKLEWLTDAIERTFGPRPTSFRAGRYGLDAIGAEVLIDLGYKVDSSVIPFMDYSDQGGPDFRRAPYHPYLAGGRSLVTPAAESPLLEIPVTVGFSRSDFAFAHRLQERCRSTWLRRLRLEGILDRLGVARRIKFSPEQADFGRMTQLVDSTLAQKRDMTVMVMLLHSSSLMPGASPYARTEEERDQLLDHFERTVRSCIEDRAFESRTLGECEGAVQEATSWT
ncbi:MAG TPA: polysaccharide deacetylase family protein [Caulifigura sp.]|jgi:hypothetical protein|nr:polysaccharide deacetylase family protein [Caulifigura sp.]